MSRLRTIIVGLNHYHVTGWVESLTGFPDQIEIVGRFDPDPARENLTAPSFSDPHLPSVFPAWMSDVPFPEDLDELIETCAPDLALITLPNVLAPQAIANLARRGVHMLIDKPGGANAISVAEACRTVSESGVKATVAFTRRYSRPWQHVAAALAAGRLGRLLTVEAMFTTSSVFARDPENLIFDRALMGGGVLSWLGVHDIDLIHWLSGQKIAFVQAMTGMTNDAGIDVEDTVSAAFVLEGGALGSMHAAYALPRAGGEGYVALRGTKGAVRIDVSGETRWTGPGSRDDPLMTEQTTFEFAAVPGYGTAGHAIIADLIDAIETDRQPLATLNDAVAVLRVVDAIYASARTGGRVTVEEGHHA